MGVQQFSPGRKGYGNVGFRKFREKVMEPVFLTFPPDRNNVFEDQSCDHHDDPDQGDIAPGDDAFEKDPGCYREPFFLRTGQKEPLSEHRQVKKGGQNNSRYSDHRYQGNGIQGRMSGKKEGADANDGCGR